MSHQAPATSTNILHRYGAYLAAFLIAVLFCLYTYGLSENPPGFYRDESAFAYNAYLIAKTGGALVISSEQNCTNCEVLFTRGQFFLYRKR